QTATTATQSTLVNIWCKVLGLEHISIADSFFDLGGTSLDMVRVNDELSKLYPTENLLIQMFKYPTISALAAFLDGGTNGTNTITTVATNEDVRKNRMRQREKRRS
ncbi:MAG TPA: acyl carrier protein, partial [Chitinophagaceae bacterium]|nr:acyl carrier protein [Chitinophagaceae bacterium]